MNNIKYVDNMLNLSYADAEHILLNKGIKVRHLEHSEGDEAVKSFVQLQYTDDDQVATCFNAGKLSASSANQYLQKHFGPTFVYARGIPMDGNVVAAPEPGILTKHFPLAAEAEDREPGFQTDMVVHARFLSLETEDYTGFVYSDKVLPWDKGLRILDCVPNTARAGLAVYNLPTEPFYMVIKELHVLDVEHFRGLGYYCNQAESGSYVLSNWKGAAYNLPPNSLVAGNRKIELNRTPAVTPQVVSVASVSRTSSKLSLVEPKADIKEDLAKLKVANEKFISSPSHTTFMAVFASSKEVKKFMKTARATSAILAGSAKRRAVKEVRDGFHGTWVELFEKTKKVLPDEVDHYYMLGNLSSQVIEKDGKPAFLCLA